MRELGYNLIVDGIFGPKSKEALKSVSQYCKSGSTAKSADELVHRNVALILLLKIMSC